MSDTTNEAKPDEQAVASALPQPEEVEARSADLDHATTKRRKVFVLGPGARRGDDAVEYTKAAGFDHEANFAATRQEAIGAGLWPVGDVRFVSSKLHADGVSRELTYEVDVRPAVDVLDESPNPEVIADDTDKGGASKAQNADAGKAPDPDKGNAPKRSRKAASKSSSK